MIALSGITIQSKIYESSNSLVYRGIRTQDEQAIIVKLLKQDYPSLQELTRYRQEYQITRSLSLEGVVKAYSQQDYQRTLVILLEDFGGESIEWWMRNYPDFCPMSLSSFLRFAIDLTDTLGKLHSANIIHKDINPGNIVLNLDTGVVKIIDFGIATQFSRTHPTFKSPHVLEGTLAYLSPEQTGRMNRLLDYRTDFYSLGVTFYQLLTGQLPFPTTDILELVHCHIAKQPMPPHESNAAIPKPISEIILKLMAKNAEDRYQSAWGIKADLEYCADQFTTTGQINPIELGLKDISDQFHIPQKLYGREAEVEVLLASFERVAATDFVADEADDLTTRHADHPSVLSVFHPLPLMLVSGYPGIGKSALVQELYKPTTAKRGYFVSGKFDQFQRNIPYSAIAHALQKLVQQLLGEPDKQMQQWRSRLLTALGNNGQLIIDVIPEIELIIGKQLPVPEVGATEAQNRFNRVFQSFVRVFCSKEHPLVIFLDDLQWIDSATLKLIELIMLDEQTQFLFLIGAYRDNEVNLIHPLLLALNRLKQQGAVLQEIVLAPLTLEPLSQLIAETLYQDTGAVRSLAQLVLRKTEGNPFFVNEFLRMLYREGWLTFDVEQRGWQWDIAQIQAQEITGNVVELLLLQLKKLPKETQQILRLAACIGAEFDLETLAIVCEKSPQVISLNLRAAIQAELIQSLSELDENLLVQEYKFLHDRVQQATYALIDESQKEVVHLQIGRNLLRKTLLEQLSERLFEIVDHLNYGIELVSDQVERDEIAKLNLLAGQKAKGAIAYSTSRNYLATGRQWLEVSSWQTNYDLTLEFFSETTEVAYLCGDFEQVEYWAAIVLQEAKTILDSVKVYEVKMQTNMAQGERAKTVNTALQVLQQFGLNFPENPTQSDVQLELDAITFLLSQKPIEDLVHLPEMTELDKLAAMRILSNAIIAAQISAPDLVPLLVSKQVNLSIRYGNTSISPFAYANFGFILCGIGGDIELGYKFGQLALRQLSQPRTWSFKTKTLLFVNIFIVHWKEHIETTSKPFLEGYQIGLETGDLEFAAYCAHSYCFQCIVAGKELRKVEREMSRYNEAIRQINQKTTLIWNKIFQQFVLNLMGCSVNPTHLIGESYNEQNELPYHQAISDGTAIFGVYFNKLFLCYLFSEYTQAVENAALAKHYLICVTPTFIVPLYYFYTSLSELATYHESGTQAQEEILKSVALNQERIKHWAHYAPMNYLHKYHLVQAEKARVLGQCFEAEELYEQAIRGARNNEYLQEEALAYELAAKHYLARGREKIAQLYVKEAHYCYERWGATAKVKDLETRYPQFFAQSSSIANTLISQVSKTNSNTSSTTFDLVAILKASQAIAREIELEQLLCSLMQILIENAGAQTGCLILEDTGKWVIEATCELHDGKESCTIQVMQSFSTVDRLPESIVQYVIRTHETVLLDHAACEGNFISDPYIKQNQTQSLFCLPLLNQSKLIGVLYLENQLATGVFTPERSQVLNLLSTQAAIAIENAKLYSKLRASESQMHQFLEAVQVGIGVLDATGRPYYVNQRGIQLLGKGVDPFVEPDHLAEVYQVYLAGTNQTYPTEKMPPVRALSGERTRVDNMEIHQNDNIIPVEAWGTPIFDEQGKVAYAITAFQDITKRKQAEQLLTNYNRTLEQQVAERTAALRESEAELRALFAAVPDPLFVLTAEGRVIEAVEVGADRLYKPLEEQQGGKTLHEIFSQEQADEFLAYIYQVLSTQQVLTVEYNLQIAGQTAWFSARIAPIRPDQVIWLARDITDRKRAERASILEERNRMAREIHDTLAQAFTGVLVHMGTVSRLVTTKPEAVQTHIDIVRELARSGLTEARRSVAALRPQSLEDGNLWTALERFVSSMQASTETSLICEIIGTPYVLPAETENNLLRIAQEAFTNAIRYANATEIRIKLFYESTQCCLQIRDNGQGFEVNPTVSNRGFGLLGMTERAERIGSQLSIESQLGQGTEVIISVHRGASA